MKKLLLLVAAGVAIKLFLDSDKGRELKDKASDWWLDMQDKLYSSLENAAEATTEKIENTASKIDNVLPG
jgi:hypothetical protein